MEGLIYSILIWFSGISVATDIPDSDIEYKNPINNHIELSISKGNSCIECHSDIMAAKRKHQPAVEDCQKCHVKNSNNHPQQGVDGFNLASEKTALCFNCHTGLKEKKNLHQPSKDGQCVDCHSPHSSKNKKLVLEKKSAKLCNKCHQMDIGEEDVVHNPVKSGRCNKCHDSHQSEFESFLKWDMPDLCYKCHDGVAEEMNLKRVHAPAKDDCFKCHDAHNAKESYLLTDSVPNLCYTCHSDIKTKKNIHQPAAEGKCLTCHNTHGSKNKKLLVDKKSNKMCSQCHQLDIKEDYYVHNPVKSGRCHKCHDSHQSDFNAFLMADKDDLCFRCHSEMKERKDTAAFVHKSLNVKQKCSNCHSPHASKEPAFLLKNEKEMCLTCHNRTFTSKKGKVENIKQLLKQSKTIHTPVKEGCIKCHDPHTSEIYSLLLDNLPEGEYAHANAENFALCFKCHNSAILETPLSDTVTNFRNGKENMHYVHVQGRKGRNCKICHNIHGSESKNLINLTASFGDWKMNMNYKITQDGGSCNTGCHGEKEYNRKQKFINDPDFDITTIKKYSDYVEEFKKVDEQERNTEKEVAEVKVENKVVSKTEIEEKGTVTRTEQVLEEEEQKTDSLAKKEVVEVKLENKVVDKLEIEKKDTATRTMQVLVVEELETDSITKKEVVEVEVENKVVDKIEIEGKDTITRTEQVKVEEEQKSDSIFKKKVAEVEVENKVVGKTEIEEKDTVTRTERVVMEDQETDSISKKEITKVEDVGSENNYRSLTKDSINTTQQIVSKNGLNKKLKDVPKEQTSNKTETKIHLIFKFEYASDALIDDTENEVVKLVTHLKNVHYNKIEIHGHADTFGSNKYNYQISKKRAERVKSVLIENGINPSRIKIKYHGSKQPVESNLTDEGRAKNRRVEIFIKN